MAANWLYTVEFGVLDGNVYRFRNKEYEIITSGADAAEDFSDAQAEAVALKAALLGFSDVNVVKEILSLVTTSGTIPTAVGNLWKEAVMTLAISADGTKKATLRVPAPKTSSLTTSGKEISPTSAQTQALIARFQGGGKTRLSDGETVRTDSPLLASRLANVKSGQNY